MNFLKKVAAQVPEIKKPTVSEFKISPRNLLLLSKFSKLIEIAEKAKSIDDQLKTFDNTRAKAEDLFNSKKSLSNEFASISSSLQLIAKMASFVTEISEASKSIPHLLTTISDIEKECKKLLEQLGDIQSDINTKKILESASTEVFNLGKQFMKEILAGELEGKTLKQLRMVHETVEALDKRAKEMKEKTDLLQKGYEDLIGLVKGKIQTAESDKTSQAVTFLSGSSTVSNNIDKTASALSEFKL